MAFPTITQSDNYNYTITRTSIERMDIMVLNSPNQDNVGG